MIGGGLGYGIGGMGSQGAITRGRIQGSPMMGMNYPHPFFDVAHTYLPVTVKQLFRWCRYYFLTSPLINATVFKLSEYPITDIIIEHENSKVRARWEEYFQDHLRFRPFQIECGLDYHVYGNSFVSLAFPFHKYLKCAHCGLQERADKIRGLWTFTNLAFRLNCPKCGNTSDAIPQDFYYKDANKIQPVRWNCEHIEVTSNDITGDSTYFYTIPPAIRNDVVIGKKDIVENIPQVFIQALREKKGIVFAKDNFFHMKRPTLAQQDRGWGMPIILPVLKMSFYLQLMMKSQESILLEHITPLRILFPNTGSSSADPYTSISLQDWRDQVAQEIARWRHDQNYIPIMGIPIGNQTIGGDGRALLLTQEIQMWSEQILAGLGVPHELIFGGLTWSGSNVSLRMLENIFLGFILRHKHMANWMMKQVASYMDWPEATVRFKPFKMADDIQRKAYLLQLNMANKISDSTLLADVDLDQEKEDEIMVFETAKRLESTRKQQLAMAGVQGEAQVIMAKAQAKAQQTMAEAQMAPQAPGEPGGENPLQQMSSPLGINQALPQEASTLGGASKSTTVGIDINQMAESMAQQISQLPPDQQELAIANIKAQSPELAQLVQQVISQIQSEQMQLGMPGQGGQSAQQAATQVNTTPLPEARAPRRAGATI